MNGNNEVKKLLSVVLVDIEILLRMMFIRIIVIA